MEPMGPASDWSWQTIASFKVVPTNGMPVDLQPPVNLIVKQTISTNHRIHQLMFTNLAIYIPLNHH